jgi:hypothetical protein
MFVDNRAKAVYGQRYIDDYSRGDVVPRIVDAVMTAVRVTYQKEAELAASRRKALPAAESALRKIRDAVHGTLRAMSGSS